METQENRYCKNFDVLNTKNYGMLANININGRTIVLAQWDTDFGLDYIDMPFLVGYADSSFDETMLHDVNAHTDFLAAVTDYTGRIQKETELLKAERREHEFFLKDDCIPDSADDDLTGKLVVLSHMAVDPECSNSREQLVKVALDEDGKTILAKTINDGKGALAYYWLRESVIGVIKPERIPKWAKEKLREMQPRHKSEMER